MLQTMCAQPLQNQQQNIEMQGSGPCRADKPVGNGLAFEAPNAPTQGHLPTIGRDLTSKRFQMLEVC